MACCFCVVGTNLVEAHILPEGFFRRLRPAGHVLRLLSSDEHPKRIPAGVYDKGILCADCEPLFGPWDMYAQEVLRDDLVGARVQRVDDLVVGHEIDDWRYDLLKLFFVSLLWRASVSTHPMFHRISLGPLEEVARGMLRRGDPGSSQSFAVALSKFDARDGRAILDPHVERIDGIKYARFYLGLYVAWIKIDSRAGAAWLEHFVLVPGQPLKIIDRGGLTEGRELSVLQRLVAKSQNRRYVGRRRV